MPVPFDAHAAYQDILCGNREGRGTGTSALKGRDPDDQFRADAAYWYGRYRLLDGTLRFDVRNFGRSPIESHGGSRFNVTTAVVKHFKKKLSYTSRLHKRDPVLRLMDGELDAYTNDGLRSHLQKFVDYGFLYEARTRDPMKTQVAVMGFVNTVFDQLAPIRNADPCGGSNPGPIRGKGRGAGCRPIHRCACSIPRRR